MKWLMQNAKQRMAFAAKNPKYVLGAMLRELTLADERFLAKITGASVDAIREYLDEPISSPAFSRHLRETEQNFRELKIMSADLYAKKVLFPYAAVRALRPQVVVETGIANGVSSAYILLALHRNQRGALHSIGLPDPAYLPEGMEAGWFVPKWLRKPWHVHLGDAKEILPKLLPELGRIDIFLHDSLHTYEHMLWEFEIAYPFLRLGELLFADDALWNSAFEDFARKVGTPEARILRGVGVLRKNGA
jgi:predicted O-methyltransferase YrrM